MSKESIAFLRSTGDLEKHLAKAGFDYSRPIEQRNSIDMSRITYIQEYGADEIEDNKFHDDKIIEAYNNKYPEIQKWQEYIYDQLINKAKINPAWIDSPNQVQMDQLDNQKIVDPKISKPPVNNLLFFKDIVIE